MNLEECEKPSLLTTGTFNESSLVNYSLLDWRYETKRGVFVAIHGITHPGLAEEISDRVALLLSDEKTCVRISVQRTSENHTIPPEQLVYLNP
jgi:hypothetical protein